MENESAPPMQHGHRKRKWLILGTITLLTVLTTLGLLWYFLVRETDPFSAKIEQEAKVSLYYPKGAPINKQSIELTNGGQLLTYSVKQGSSTIFLTVQPKPPYFDNTAFQKGIKEASEISTPQGNAVIGNLGGRTIGNLVTVDSWILASSANKSSSGDIAETLKLLVKN